MGQFIPLVIACTLLLKGVMVFRESFWDKLEDMSLIPTYIFLLAAFLLLWDVRLYPRSLRKLLRCLNCTFELFTSIFLLEIIMSDFWLALLKAVMHVPRLIAGRLEEQAGSDNDLLRAICEALQGNNAACVTGYLLAIFFLLSVLHATRAIDFRELECGIGPFFRVIILRIKRSFKRMINSFGFGRRKQLKRSRSGNRNSGCSLGDPCLGPEEFSDFDLGDEPMDKTEGCDHGLRTSFSDFERSLKDD